MKCPIYAVTDHIPLLQQIKQESTEETKCVFKQALSRGSLTISVEVKYLQYYSISSLFTTVQIYEVC